MLVDALNFDFSTNDVSSADVETCRSDLAHAGLASHGPAGVNASGRRLIACRQKKARPKRPGLLGESAHNKFAGQRIYFAPVFPIGGATTSLCCAQAPSPKAVTIRATTRIVLKNFNLSRLLSSQVAPVCLGREERRSNAFLHFFKPSQTGRLAYFE
jgi:hypothetical protein